MINYWLVTNLLILIWGLSYLASNLVYKDVLLKIQVQKILFLCFFLNFLFPFFLKEKFELKQTDFIPKALESSEQVPHSTTQTFPTNTSLEALPNKTDLASSPFVENAQDFSKIPFYFFILSLLSFLAHLYVQIRKVRALQKNSFCIRSLRKVSIWISQSEHSPFIYWLPGSLKVIIPYKLLEKEDSLKTILNHEFSHHRLHHTKLIYFLEALDSIFFFNPGIKAFKNLAADLMEYQCDREVLKRKDPEIYSYQLLNLAQSIHHSLSIKVMTFSKSNSQLKRRLHMIFSNGHRQTKTFLKTLKIGALVLPTLGASLVCANMQVGSGMISLSEGKAIVSKIQERSINPENLNFPIDMNEKVLHYLNAYVHTEEGLDFLLSSKANLAGQEAFLTDTLRKSQVPAELIAIPFVEAGFSAIHEPRPGNPSAGLWQFIRETAQKYGLKVTPRNDERYHTEKATQAAIRLFKDLYAIPQFNQDWRLVILAYNAGERSVLNAIQKKGTDNPWELGNVGDPDYLAKIMAALIILRTPDLGSVQHPLPNYSKVSSHYGPREPVFDDGKSHFHSGMDLVANRGSSVYSPKPGKVKEVNYNSKDGNIVVIEHTQRVETRYHHLSTVQVAEGQRVHEGDVLGNLGNTGASTGPHLHFEIRINSKAVDPRIFISKYEVF